MYSQCFLSLCTSLAYTATLQFFSFHCLLTMTERERETERESGYGTERPRRRQGLSTSPRGISAMVSESASEQNFIPDLCHSYSLLYLPLTHLWLMYECVLICNGLEA